MDALTLFGLFAVTAMLGHAQMQRSFVANLTRAASQTMA